MVYPTGFKINGADFNDVYVRAEYFTEGGLWVWGCSSQGGLGDNGSIVHKSSPVQTVAGGSNWKLVSSGYYHAAAIKTDGTLWTWGWNNYGQLGDNSVINKSSPVQTVASGTDWKQVSCNTYATSAIKTDGTLWTWGINQNGGLGDNTIIHRSSPVQTVAGGTNWNQVSVGLYHTSAIKTDGTLWSWGLNTFGGLGDNTIIHRSSPVQTVAGGTNWKQISCGRYYVSVIKTDGTLWTWGHNSYGSLGDNSLTAKSSPVQTVAGGNNWKQISCCDSHSAAIKSDGSLWLWGRNVLFGCLGDNTTANKSSPVQTVSSGTNWKQVIAQGSSTASIKTDGTLWTWGFNTFGGLGDNTTIHRSSPVQTVTGGTNWKLVGGTGLVSSIIRDLW